VPASGKSVPKRRRPRLREQSFAAIRSLRPSTCASSLGRAERGVIARYSASALSLSRITTRLASGCSLPEHDAAPNAKCEARNLVHLRKLPGLGFPSGKCVSVERDNGEAVEQSNDFTRP